MALIAGLLETRPGLSQLSPARIHVTAIQGTTKTVSVRIRKTGSSVLVWEVADPTFGAASAWLSAPAAAGLLRAQGEEVSIDFVFDAAVATSTSILVGWCKVETH